MKFEEFKNSINSESSAKNMPIMPFLIRELIRRNLFQSYKQYLGSESNIDLIFDELKKNWDENMVVGSWPPENN